MRSAALLLGMLFIMWSSSAGRAAAVPQAADSSKLSGVYECKGTGADGRAYEGAVIIEPDGDRFFLQWVIAAQRTAIGLGNKG